MSSNSEEFESISEILNYLGKSEGKIVELNKTMNQMIETQNFIRKKIKKAQIKRKLAQIKENRSVSMTHGVAEVLNIDIDSIRTMVLTSKLSILSRKMRLSRTFQKHRDPEC